jgi:hypothetical protein
VSIDEKLKRLAEITGLPGVDYATRVGTVLTNAFVGHFDAVNQTWRGVQDGSLFLPNGVPKLAELAKTCAGVASSYYAVVTEAARGPAFIRQPIWVSFDFDKKHPAALKASVTIPRSEPGSQNPSATDFAPLGSGLTPLSGVAKCTWNDTNHSIVGIELAEGELGKAAEGQYLGTVILPTRTSEPPLVMMMLRVRKSS